MALLQTLLVTVVTLGVLVTVHEFGHFWVARRCGVRVLRFSVGFGTALWRRTDRHGTEFVIAAVPLGGYVKMLDERESEVAPEERQFAFNRQSPWARIAIAAAGPLANFALAILVYWVVFMGGVQGVAPVIGSVQSGSLAASAGLEKGQEIVAVDGVETPTWESLRLRLLDRIGETGSMRIAYQYPDSNLKYESEIHLDGWMRGVAEPDPLVGLGIDLYRPAVEPIVEEVVPGGAAEAAGIQPGDRIVEADGVPVEDWNAWVEFVRARPGQRIDLVVERSGEAVALAMTPARKEAEDGSVIGFVGIGVKPPAAPPEDWLREYHYGVGEALAAGVKKTGEMTMFTLRSLQKMITGLLSPKNLSGPITIAKVAGASAEYGLTAWLSFLALLSVSLAVLNLLPIPVLDGGHICYALIEGLVGKPVTERVQEVANQLGLVLIVCVMVLALYNDVLRL